MREFAALRQQLGQAGRSQGAAEFRAAVHPGDYLEARSGEVAIAVRPVGGLGAARSTLFPDGAQGFIGDSASWVMAHSRAGMEDYLRLAEPGGSVSFERDGRVAVAYEVRLDGAAGLRLVGGVLEFLDRQGTPRLRMRAPYAVDADGRRLPLDVSVKNCHVDMSPSAPWERPVTPPGADQCRLELSFEAAARFPVWVDPGWTTTNALAVPRTQMARVEGYSPPILAVGGIDQQGQPLDSVEVYHAGTGTWAMSASLNEPRANGTLFHHPVYPGLLTGGGLASSEYFQEDTVGWAPGPQAQWVPECSVRAQVQGLPDYLFQLSSQNGSLEVEYLAENGTSWQRLDAGVAPPARVNWGCSSLGSAVWVAGGEDPQSGVGLTSTWILDTSSAVEDQAELRGASWQPGPDIAPVFPTGVSRPLLTKNVLTGGDVDGALSQSTIILGESAGGWKLQYGPDMPNAIERPGVVWDSGVRLWLFGGRDAGGAPSDVVMGLFPANPVGGWGGLRPLPTARQDAGVAVSSDGAFVVFGGQSGSDVLAVTEVFRSEPATCSVDAQCFGGSCREGICCDAPCDGVCMACESSRTGRPDGECAPVLNGAVAFGDDCPSSPGDECGFDGTCDGAGSCHLPGEETVCWGDCVGDDLREYVCSGTGECVKGEVRSCGAYVCSHHECPALCSSDRDCSAGYECTVDSRCVLPKNCSPYETDSAGNCVTPCASDRDCVFGFYCSEGGECWAEQEKPLDLDLDCDCCCVGNSSARNDVAPGVGPMMFALLWFRRRKKSSRK